MSVDAPRWTNWSGVLSCAPVRIECPSTEEEIVELVRAARTSGRLLRPVGAGHSSMPLVETDEVMISLERFSGVTSHDRNRLIATARGGTNLNDLGRALLDADMSMENMGDVDYQSIAGAVATGTHGTGLAWGSIASTVVAMRLVNGLGEIVECSEAEDAATMAAARISLGTMGVCIAVTLRCLPALRIYERRWCMPVEEALARFDELGQEYEYLDFYWYPRRDEVGIRARGFVSAESASELDPAFGRVGWLSEILPHDRTLKFNEMEYALPRAAGPDCFRAVRKRMLERHVRDVAWRVLYRTVASEDAYLSPSYQRDSATISVHQNAHLPFKAFFGDIEPIFRSFEGRPHWAKRNTLKRDELRALYPMWDRFCEIRRRFDPDGIFLNTYLRQLFT